jgi:hypothetical protein
VEKSRFAVDSDGDNFERFSSQLAGVDKLSTYPVDNSSGLSTVLSASG